MARIKANIRRQTFKKSGDQSSLNKVRFNEIDIDKDSYEVAKNGVVLDLTLREYELIKFLSSQPEKVFSREELLQKVWGYEYYGDVRTVDVTVRRLREKVDDDDSKPNT
jgi:two-component system response regulator VicR